MKKIVIVVADGKVESIFVDTNEEVEVEVVDFDSNIYDFEEQERLGDYVDELRATKKEIVC